MRQDKSIQQAAEALISEERRMAEAVRRGDMAGYRYFTDRHARRVQQLVASMMDDERSYHFAVARHRSAKWIPKDWPSLKSYVNGRKEYFK